MSVSSGIEWTDATWNPVTGCSKISPGCDHCYAERLAVRLQRMGNPRYQRGFEVTLHPDQLELPLRWRGPRRIFVNSMSDLFHARVPMAFVDQVFDVMGRSPQHVFQVLTKRPDRLVSWHRGRGPVRAIPPHVWIGTSIESNDYVWRAERLRQVEAQVRFISAEPLLGPLTDLELDGIAWVIAGGESAGPAPRALVERTLSGWRPKPEASAWVRRLRDRCQSQGVTFFFKQWGGPTPKTGGRELDGQRWSQYPLSETLPVD